VTMEEPGVSKLVAVNLRSSNGGEKIGRAKVATATATTAPSPAQA
jgi:hypothetical protein